MFRTLILAVGAPICFVGMSGCQKAAAPIAIPTPDSKPFTPAAMPPVQSRVSGREDGNSAVANKQLQLAEEQKRLSEEQNRIAEEQLKIAKRREDEEYVQREVEKFRRLTQETNENIRKTRERQGIDTSNDPSLLNERLEIERFEKQIRKIRGMD